MPSPLLEETEVGVSVDPDERPADMDETAFQFVATVEVACCIHDGISSRIEAGEVHAPVVTQDDIDELEATIEVGNEVLQRDDWEAIKRDFSRLDDDTLADVHATAGNVAAHLGLDLDVTGLMDNGGDD